MGIINQTILYLAILIMVVALAVWGVANFYQWLRYLLQKKEEASIKYFWYGWVLITPAPIYILHIITRLQIDYLNHFAIGVFILSSLFGLGIFLVFVQFFFEKQIKNVIITLFMGSVVFLFFAPSAYFTFSPVVQNYFDNKMQDAQSTLDLCNQRNNDYYCLEMAKLYIEGDGVEQDYAKALKLYNKRADANSSFANYALGDMYEEGKIVSTDAKKALSYYKKACSLKNTDGCIKVAEYFMQGRIVEKDVSKAEATFFNYCIRGSQSACKHYLTIHPSVTIKRYSTDKEFNDVLKDDPSNWNRAFDTPQPRNLNILKSQFKSSSGLCCTRYSFDFKIEMNSKDREIALANFDLKEEAVNDLFPMDFLDDKSEKYWVFSENTLYVAVDKRTKVIYIHYDGYIDGR